MKWKQDTPPEPPNTPIVMEYGDVRLSIQDAYGNDPRNWLCVHVLTGEHTDRPISECKEHWPREAIQKAREALDEFEAKLEEEVCTAESQPS